MQLLYTIQVNGNSVEINNSIQTFAYPINTVSTTKIDENNFYLYAQNRNIPFIIDWRNVTIPDYNNYVDIDAFLLDLNNIINPGVTTGKNYKEYLSIYLFNSNINTVITNDFKTENDDIVTITPYNIPGAEFKITLPFDCDYNKLWIQNEGIQFINNFSQVYKLRYIPQSDEFENKFIIVRTLNLSNVTFIQDDEYFINFRIYD